MPLDASDSLTSARPPSPSSSANITAQQESLDSQLQASSERAVQSRKRDRAAESDQEIASRTKTGKQSKPRNAFAAIMSSKGSPKTIAPKVTSKWHQRGQDSRRDGLGEYINKPETYPLTTVIFHDSEFVAIHDLYPKASIHTLLLPRNPVYNRMHPIEAFEDPEFLASVRVQADKLRKIVASDLRRRYGEFSAQEAPRQAIVNQEAPMPADGRLPEGRDWEKDVMVGIHAHPSMNHLHVHVLSIDRLSDCLKHRQHYNSFATPFFVELDAFPLAEDDLRRYPGREGYLQRDYKCWRCGKEFANKFASLKLHLAEEFEEWKKQ